MIPYCRHSIEPNDLEAVARVLDSDRLTQGPEVPRFEELIAARTACDEAIAVSSGTSALQIALMALGIAPGDEVLVPSLTFLSSVNAVLLAGGTPVFVDVGRDTLTLCPEDLDRKISERTVGAIAVHFAGHPVDVRAISERLGPNRFLLEDACHALGAEYEGSPAGSLGDAGCFSFHPAKHVTTGEGGAITTSDRELADRCRKLREHGVERQPSQFLGLGLPTDQAAEAAGGWLYEMHSLSANHRLPDLGAALGASQMQRLDENLDRRRHLAARYAEGLGSDARITPLAEPRGTHSAWHLFPIQLDVDRIRGGRAAVYSAMIEQGIGVQVHYIPVHLQPYYRMRFGSKFGDLPATESAYLRLLSLPLYPTLDEQTQDRIVETLLETLDRLAR